MNADAWVLVTGANRGLGYATARSLVNAGECVIVRARSQAAGAQRLGCLLPDTSQQWITHCALDQQLVPPPSAVRHQLQSEIS